MFQGNPINWRAMMAVAYSLLLMAMSARSQTVAPAAPAAPSVRPAPAGGNTRPNIRSSQTFQFTPDLFDSMMASASSFDMDSPVEAHVEFDPPEAVAGGRVIYRIEVSALDESLTLPEKLPTPAGLNLQTGGRGQTYQSSGNMKLRPQTTVIYRATVTNAGTFTVPEFDLMAYGKAVRVPAATLKVFPTGAMAITEPPTLQLDLPAGDVYVGELLRVPVILPVSPNGATMGMTQPHITGEFIFAEQFSSGLRQENVTRGGKSFTAFVEDVMVTPLRAGRQDLIGQAHTYVLRANPRQANTMQSLSMLVDSEPVPIVVKPLPKDGVLPGFTGAVGQFRLEPPALSTNQLRAGEPLTLTLIVRGEGNIGRLIPPIAPITADWQSFPPANDAWPSAMLQQRGFASFRYTLIPNRAGIAATPPIPFSYFDPNRKEYVDLTVPGMPIKVTPGLDGDVGKAEAPTVAGPDPEFDNHEKEPELSDLASAGGATAGSLTPVQNRWWFAALQLLPAATLGGLWGWDRRRRFLAAHPEVILKRRARRGLRRELRLARVAAQQRDAGRFVAAGANALREACAPHSAANPGALVCADILQELPDGEQRGRTGEMIRRLFTAADALRFGGPVADGPELLALQSDLEQLLAGLKLRL